MPVRCCRPGHIRYQLFNIDIMPTNFSFPVSNIFINPWAKPPRVYCDVTGLEDLNNSRKEVFNVQRFSSRGSGLQAFELNTIFLSFPYVASVKLNVSIIGQIIPKNGNRSTIYSRNVLVFVSSCLSF